MFNSIKNLAQTAARNLASSGVGQVAQKALSTGTKVAGNLVSAAQNYLKPQPIKAQAPAPAQAPAQIRKPAPLPPTPGSGYPYNRSTTTSFTGSTYVPPSPTEYGVQSAEDRAREIYGGLAEKYASQMSGELQGLQDYVSSRNPTNYYQGLLESQGITEQNKVLSGLQKNILQTQEDLEKYPKEDIERRAETGMLSEAARRAIRIAEAKPIQETLIGLGKSAETAQVGLDRALQLAGNMTNMYQEETQQGIAVRQAKIDSLRQQFGMELDQAAQIYSGFTQDNEAALRQYEMAVQQGYQLDQQQMQVKNQLEQQQNEHLRVMEQSAQLANDARTKSYTLNDVMGKYVAQGMDPNLILTLYNTYSKYGEAKESAGTLASRYGVDLNRFGDTAGSALQTLINR